MRYLCNVFIYKNVVKIKKTLKNVKKRNKNKKRKNVFLHLCVFLAFPDSSEFGHLSTSTGCAKVVQGSEVWKDFEFYSC